MSRHQFLLATKVIDHTHPFVTLLAQSITASIQSDDAHNGGLAQRLVFPVAHFFINQSIDEIRKTVV
jgi:hypothetical protein